MAFRCDACGGSMIFDARIQKMRCLHCDGTREPEEFAVRDVGYGSEDESGLRVYTCRGCGAVLEGTDESMVGFCPYCGGQALTSEAATGGGAESIIPFQLTKEICIEAYGAHVKGIPLMPREFRDPAFIERFCGIYMPFWRYDVRFGKGVFQGKKTIESTRDYDEIGYFEVETQPSDMGVETFDASRYLDDQLALRAMPIREEDLKPYNPAYLSGFYADRSTVGWEVYSEDAARRARNRMLRAMADGIERDHDIYVDDNVSTIDATLTGSHTTLVPLWFLTWRKDDRVAYAVVNGDTGKVVCDMPLDLPMLALACALVAIAIFAVLELFFESTPTVTCLLSLVAAMGMARGIQVSARREFERVYHMRDKGYGTEVPDDVAVTETKEKRRKHKTAGSFDWQTVLSIVGIVFLFVIGGMGEIGGFSGRFDEAAEAVMIIAKWCMPIAALIMALVTGMEVYKLHGTPSVRIPLVATIVLTLSILVSALVLIASPVNDGWYYAADAVGILVLIVSAWLMIRTFNVSCTRPVPKLFDREEVEQ